ncbi:methylthioribulose 1-phosphate dehydratase [Acidisoma sp. C75]
MADAEGAGAMAPAEERFGRGLAAERPIEPSPAAGCAVPRAIAEALVAVGLRMDARGWVPATAGNLSARLTPDRLAITRSGAHKGFLTPEDIMAVDLAGESLTPGLKPSAETLLHCQLYALFPGVGAVLHGHSVAATALTMARPEAAEIRLDGYEVLKAWGETITSHEVSVPLPVIANDQDMPRLAAQIAPLLRAGRAPIGYVLRGHGVYVWGADIKAALYRLEALEFLLAVEIERRKLA